MFCGCRSALLLSNQEKPARPGQKKHPPLSSQRLLGWTQIEFGIDMEVELESTSSMVFPKEVPTWAKNQGLPR